MAYSPKYVNLEDVPVRQVPDDYDKAEKEDSLEFAEASIELDLYNGETIAPEDRIPQVIAAIKQKATCELVKGAEDPTSTKLGDLDDSGTNKTDYANSFCDRYDEIVEKITDSDVLTEEGAEKTGPYTYTTSDPDGDCGGY
jgi:hypothetical protein